MRSQSFRAKDKTLDLGERTALMGIVNVTPDSFFASSRRPEARDAVQAALEMVDDGADILDVGGESTRPGAEDVPASEEARRVVPVIEALRQKTSCLLSVDTSKPDVARLALEAGADLVNDVAGLRTDEMASVVADAGAGVVVMHMQGTPRTMQQEPRYGDVVLEVRAYLEGAVDKAERAGVAPESILVDPGIGFGKTLEHNLELLGRLDELAVLQKPILIGTSRKGFLGKLLDAEAEQRIFGTAASVAAAVLRGARVVRVHDVREMRDVVRVTDAIRHRRPEPADGAKP